MMFTATDKYKQDVYSNRHVRTKSLPPCVRYKGIFEGILHRVDREDSTIIILDTKLVADFVLHACCFVIAGNRHVLKSPPWASKSLTHNNCAPESEIFFLKTSEISKLGRFIYFLYCLSTKVDITLNFRVPYNQ